jgi:hypothetical protein
MVVLGWGGAISYERGTPVLMSRSGSHDIWPEVCVWPGPDRLCSANVVEGVGGERASERAREREATKHTQWLQERGGGVQSARGGEEDQVSLSPSMLVVAIPRQRTESDGSFSDRRMWRC